MSRIAFARLARPPSPLRIDLESAGGTMLALTAMAGGLVMVEPSPFEVAFLFTLALFCLVGLRVRAGLTPLLLLVTLWLLGGFFALVPVVTKGRALQFFLVSAYLGFAAIAFAVILSDRTIERLDSVRKGYVAGGMIAAAAAVIGFFDVAGLGESLTLHGRARGTFKDPNVLGPFLVLPALWLIQDVVLGTARRRFVALAGVTLITLAVLLSFSRGAWGVYIASVGLLLGLTFLTETTGRARLRILVGGVAGLFFLALIVTAALSIDAVRQLFEVRFSLNQDYDLGETGRFGSQLRSIPLLLERPNGFGPMQFREIFPEDPHNVYIAAFAYYGWVGGVSYLTLIVVTCFFGWRLVWRRAPFQRHAIAVWSALFVQILQGFQIDTDHWRHFFLMLGAIWGMIVATRVWERAQRAAQFGQSA